MFLHVFLIRREQCRIVDLTQRFFSKANATMTDNNILFLHLLFSVSLLQSNYTPIVFVFASFYHFSLPYLIVIQNSALFVFMFSWKMKSRTIREEFYILTINIHQRKTGR